MAVRVQLVLFDFPAQRIAVNPEDLRRFRLVALGAIQHALDKPLFELPHSFVEKNPPLHHLIDEPFQLIFHDVTLRWDVRSKGPGCYGSSRLVKMRYASRYFSRVASTTSGGNSGPGGVLGQRIRSR